MQSLTLFLNRASEEEGMMLDANIILFKFLKILSDFAESAN